MKKINIVPMEEVRRRRSQWHPEEWFKQEEMWLGSKAQCLIRRFMDYCLFGGHSVERSIELSERAADIEDPQLRRYFEEFERKARNWGIRNGL